MRYLLACLLSIAALLSHAQTIDTAYEKYDFVAGEKVIFEDNPNPDQLNKPLSHWKLQEGRATIIDHEGNPSISFDEYYTHLVPVLFGRTTLPDSFCIEYDAWLDPGYDGNPGVEVLLNQGDLHLVVTPNKHRMSVGYPEQGEAVRENPEEYFGENKFYNRWVHISIASLKKHLVVYMDQYKMIDIADDRISPQDIMVTGNCSNKMKILLKNFRVTSGIPQKLAFTNGKFVTHAIRFDVNKAVLKPESIAVISSVAAYLKANSSAKMEIAGHTDSDGTADNNLKLSQQRADAVKAQLQSMGVDGSRLTTRGYGQQKPLNPAATAEAKAMNRRVEFVIN